MSKYTKVRNYTDKELINHDKSIPGFRYIPNNRWLYFVRSSEDSPNKMDDKCYDMLGETCLDVHTCTTNPGTPSLFGGFKKYKKKGSAVIASNQWMYKKFSFGYHNGRMPALRLIRPIHIFRDGNLDNKTDEVEGNEQYGNFNTNIHANNYDMTSRVIKWFINGWSAGCLVFNNIKKYSKMMNWFKKAKKSGKQVNVTVLIVKEF